MLFDDFRRNLKRLSPHLWMHEAGAHPTLEKYPDLKMIGIYFKDHHVAGVTYDTDVPEADILDEEGIMTHQGIRTILRKILDGRKEFARNLSEYWKMGNNFDQINFHIDPKKIRDLFHLDVDQIYR